jgi:hypothetical protein
MSVPSRSMESRQHDFVPQPKNLTTRPARELRLPAGCSNALLETNVAADSRPPAAGTENADAMRRCPDAPLLVCTARRALREVPNLQLRLGAG